jgi:hypothetical protein
MDYFCTVAPIGIATFIAFVSGVTALWEIKKELGRIADALEEHKAEKTT